VYARDNRNLGEPGIGRNYDVDAHTLLHLDCLVRRTTIHLALAGGESVTLMRPAGLLPF
jgi:hypothetical protein